MTCIRLFVVIPALLAEILYSPRRARNNHIYGGEQIAGVTSHLGVTNRRIVPPQRRDGWRAQFFGIYGFPFTILADCAIK